MTKTINRLVIASKNLHKIEEITRMLASIKIHIHPQPQDLEIEETGCTYLENSRLKAITVAKFSGYWTLADDSGLEVDALGGAPGLYSGRYEDDDESKIARVLEELRGSPYRSASLNTFMSLASPKGEIVVETQGMCKGEILEARYGIGPGYDSIFWVKEANRTYAQMPLHLKQKLGSRGKAARAILSTLKHCLCLSNN
uniref:Ham1 protein-like n=1 Tax=Paulinella chromatophora TaxID=39717 RepID=A6YIM7_PAUCH|nr:Ham1 protein-like protein [Paulinella chromatophora]ABS00399.1 Ham1 protein-like [Paulinella chromatophora]ACB43315.1 Ham1 protein-like protein [Paulinella chromatophora]